MKGGNRTRGRVVVVTGGTRGLGRAIAQAFAAQGDRVWTIARHPRRPVGRRFIAADVADESALFAAARRIRAADGPIEVWVNNAGGGAPVPFGAGGPEWRNVFEGNFLGTVHGCRAALAARAGNIALINIASLAGLMAPAGHSAYATAKAAVIALTRALAVEFAAQRVRVNALAPGPMNTSGFRAAGARARLLPTRRLVSVDDVAHACLWLCEPVNSLTGHTLVIDGGAAAAGCYVPSP